MIVRTLAQRKAEALQALQSAVGALCSSLAQHGSALGGRYLLYGSAARDALRWDSDVDLLLDFPDDESTRQAWDVAEEECRRLGLRADIRPLAWCDARFIAHVQQHWIPLP